jgi:hypothetical protein
MRKATLAEWILSLVMSPDRAAATTGDLLEQGTSPLGFWWGVASTVASLTWSELSAAPLNTVGIALYAFVLALVISVLFGGAAGLIIAAFASNVPGISVNELIPISLGLSWAGSFVAGVVMAQRAKGRELAACVVFLIVEAMMTLAATSWSRQEVALEGWYSSAVATVVVYLVTELFMIAGAMRVRLRRLRAA